MITYNFRIPGEPLYYYLEKDGKMRAWTFYKEQRMRWIISLESQFDDKPFLTGPLSLELQFHCRTGAGQNNISAYIKFVETICTDVVYSSPDCIIMIKAEKYITKNDPHTVVIIHETEEE